MEYKGTLSDILNPERSENENDSDNDVYNKEKSFIYLACLRSALIKRFNKRYYNIIIGRSFKYKHYYY